MEKKKRILFVCLGNICRSPAAEGVMKAVVDKYGNPDEWFIDSAGTGDYHIGDLPDGRMRRAGAKRGYRFDHRARQLHISNFEDFDMIIGMDANNVRNIKRIAPTVEDVAKVYPMARWLDPKGGYDYVPDPYYEGQEGFELVLDQLEYACKRLFDEVDTLL